MVQGRKGKLNKELTTVGKVALTSLSKDHYLTVTAHYILEGEMRQKVLTTKAVFEAQTEPGVAKFHFTYASVLNLPQYSLFCLEFPLLDVGTIS